jgi:deazaflavin-dependent oxidoreductase (nitroreductase family)
MRRVHRTFTQLPIAVLSTTGAKSGLLRHTPVLLTMDGDVPILISTNWGQDKLPGWHYNLSANPRADLELNGHKRTYLARKTEGAEREKYWALAVSQYPGYEAYRSRLGGREIGVWLLEPVKESPQSTLSSI